MQKTDFYNHLVFYSAPTLGGAKSASLFGCRLDQGTLFRYVRLANRELNTKGVHVRLLSYKNGYGLVYVFRPLMLARDLALPCAQRILRQNGYQSRSWNTLLCELMKRLESSEEFPHEIGLFLGYPAEDVDGFIRLGPSACICCGVWKVYQNKEHALAVFAQCRQCTCHCMKQWAAGVPIAQLVV